MTSDELLSIKEVPQSVAIIGAGAIGAESAPTLNDFGSEVTLIESLPEILNGCDLDLSKTIHRAFKSEK